MAPFAAALTAEVFMVANKLSQRRADHKLDPSLRLVLDELNNVAPIPELPAKMSDSGGRGIQLFAFTHNISQTERRWGPGGARELAGSANVRLILPGLLDTSTLKEISKLLGSIEEFVLSSPVSGPRGMGTGRGGSLQRRQVMEESAIRELEEGTALMINRNNRPVMLNLPCFWEDPDIRDIVAASEAPPLQGAGENRLRCRLRQCCCGGGGLLFTHVVEWRVRQTTQATVGVDCGLTVMDEVELRSHKGLP